MKKHSEQNMRKIKEKMKEYEPMSEQLESVDEKLEQETYEHDPVVAPSSQHENDIQGDADPSIFM